MCGERPVVPPMGSHGVTARRINSDRHKHLRKDKEPTQESHPRSEFETMRPGGLARPLLVYLEAEGHRPPLGLPGWRSGCAWRHGRGISVEQHLGQLEQWMRLGRAVFALEVIASLAERGA